MSREAPADHPIHSLLAARHSPRAFAARPIAPEALRSVLEAARWAPSSSNEQPWRFVVVLQSDEAVFEGLVGALAGANPRWAHRAAALIVSVARTTTASGQPNRHAWHDVGLATAQLLLEVTAQGLAAHPMGGFDRSQVTALLGVPDGYEVVAVIALGHPGEVSDLPEDLAQRETAPRLRLGQEAFAFGPRFGAPLRLVGEAPWAPLLRAWFGVLDADGMASPAQMAIWFGANPRIDDALRQRFGALHAEILAGGHTDWLADPDGRLATIIVLDQLTRNLNRGSAAMYQADARALALALAALDAGEDRGRPAAEQDFMYLPLMHAEDVDMQARCVAVFEARHDAAPAALKARLAMGVQYARRHHEIVARFGRFPHRNALLGRPSTPEEAAFLLEPGSSF